MLQVNKIVIGCDHAATGLKAKVIEHLEELGVSVTDVGTYSSDSCNYPLYAHKLCEKIQSGEFKLGILICGTGVGMSMAANKHKGIRAACCSDTFSARLTRVHNDANVLCFGERVVGFGLACDMVDEFINAEYEGGKHAKRVDMITAIEEGHFELLK
ncbi:MAG: ribose 5-phosphate isomerase B [Clostridia bacterium]|nr:ribose 5-phosphate isomerase B [Clostridia bacterium]